MKNKDLIKELSNRMNWTIGETADVVAALGNIISTKLSEGDSVYLDGLGQFETKKKGERISVNPANGQRYLVPPKLVAVFKPGGTLKNKLKEIDTNE
ncbi:MAG: HU family DNA-binding protein [Tannerellaceae bacterium]|jgi:DNA-binding protein HU-beta|nr:HU family DNA-binding protein [Tannerellaceae bacterium]